MASAVNCANRQRVEETLEKFVSFVDRHQWVIIVNTVSFFTEKMWERIIVPHFGDVARQIIHLTEGEIARLPTGHLPRQNDKERELSAIHLFIEECLEHRLENTNVLCNVDGVLNELGSGKSQIQDKELSSLSTVKLVQPRALMNIKKSHEVKEMASFAAKLALIHEVQKVVDIGSGKGYLGQYLSLQCGLDVIGIDSSDSNTHGAIDRNCKLQKNWQGISRHSMNAQQNCSQLENPIEAFKEKFTTKTHKLKEIQKFVKCSDKMSDTSLKIDRCRSQALVNMHESNSQSEGSEVSASHMVNWSRISQSESAFDDVHQRLMNIQQSDSQSPATLTSNEASDISHEMRISKHLQMIDLFSDDDCPAEVNKPKCGYNQTNHNSDSDKKENNPATQEGWNSSSNNSPCHGNGNATMNGSRFYPVTAFVEPSTTLTSMVSQNVEEAEQDKEIPFMLVGLHTCGDLAPSTLRLFVHNDTARVLLNVGCCYQRLSEEFETEGWTILETKPELCGFPMSHFLRSKGTKINRPARMLASMIGKCWKARSKVSILS
ncbi:methyltransferase-like protein 25 isoform X2 [Acanthaster planci]|uniref:Methyltransferase-like protein 25 isoform X2 n=1 Tax=Acanthaster planci TaxID=133434 RepID=A0A8B7YMV2_ACAPL|nr:methyltransferase-like protein 25 isoform X2 [Acanthaster planci]